MRIRNVIPAAVLLTLCASAAWAGPRDIATYVTRLGGDSATAQPYIDKFLRYVETATGWPAASMKGSFLTSKKEALDYIAGAKPGIGMLEPQLYFELRKSQGLTPILQVESAELNSPRLNVVVKDPAIKGLADLKGKRLWTMLADYPRYLSKVVLGGQADAADFTLKQIGQALKGVRAVLRGDCDATVLDDEQLAKAKEITGGGDLRALYTSAALPPIVVVQFGSGAGVDKDALVKALTGMCGSGTGAAICKEMHIGRFVPVNAAIFGDAQGRYGE